MLSNNLDLGVNERDLWLYRIHRKTSVYLSQGGGGEVLPEILTLFQTKKCLTRFQTRPFQSIPVFRPDLFNPYPFSDLAFRQKLCQNYLD